MITTILNNITIAAVVIPSVISSGSAAVSHTQNTVPVTKELKSSTSVVPLTTVETVVTLAEQGEKINPSPIPLVVEPKPVSDKSATDTKEEATKSVLPKKTSTVTSAPVAAPASSFDEVYKQAGAKYGVPWQVLYGIHMTETGGRDGKIMNASGSGARGPMQFMPGTWAAYGVDGNGDGVADIDNAVDAIYGAANFLAKHGSLEAGLRSYGGNTARTLALARERGYEAN